MQMPVSWRWTGGIVRTGLYVSKAHKPRTQDDWNAAAWASAQVHASSQPAALVNADGTIFDANQPFDALLVSGRLVSALQAAVIESCLSQRTHVARISTRTERGDDLARRFDVTLMPVDATKTLAVARDTTLEANLINALAASRQLFRDLALCSNDFAFETDAFAHFTYTSPGGLLGHTTQDLHGARPRSFFPNAEVNQLFSVKTPIQGREAWTTDRSGDDACIVVTAIPMHDSTGEWCGARRGRPRHHAPEVPERDVADGRAREDLVSAIVTAMRAQIEPRRMMLAAADAIAAATNADCTTIEAPQVRMQVSSGSASEDSHVLVRQTAHPRLYEWNTFKLARASSEPEFGPHRIAARGHGHAPSGAGHRTRGAHCREGQ